MRKFNLLEHILARTFLKKMINNYNNFQEATKNPKECQKQVLFEILEKNKYTEYGKEHFFNSIKTIADFQNNIQINPYNSLEKYIEKVKEGNFSALLNEKPVMFATTSGTEDRPKFIPITPEYIKNYKRTSDIWSLKAIVDHPNFRKKILAMVSQRTEGILDSGIPYGSSSGLFFDLQRFIAKMAYVVKKPVFSIKDQQTKYYTAMRIALGENIRHINTANPSTVLSLCRTADKFKEELVKDIYDGGICQKFNIPQEIKESLSFNKNKKRARQLELIIKKEGKLLPKNYWPNLELIGCWMGGTLALYVERFPEFFGDVHVRDLGLLASEGRMSIPLEDRTASGVLDISGGFYEFIPEEQIKLKNPETRTVEEIEDGKKYFIILTNKSGLYRYDIKDFVEVAGFYNKTPMIKFLNKGKNISSITGEKLTEFQVINAVKEISKKEEKIIERFIVCPVWDSELPYYTIMSDEQLTHEFISGVDKKLQDINTEYNSKRKSGRLRELNLTHISTSLLEELASERKRQGREEQFKHCYLNPSIDFYKKVLNKTEIKND